MKRIALASLFTLAISAGAAQAYGIDASTIPGQAPGATGHVAGGGGAVLSGGGDNAVIAYSTGGAGGGSLWTQVPRRSALANGKLGAGSGFTGGEYTEPERARGLEAWMVGGGDNTEVLYSKPR